MDKKRHVRISKFLSLVLRHNPGEIGIALDANGWVAVDELLRALSAHHFPLTRAELDDVVANNSKKRFAYSDDGLRIRANQGHSVNIDLGYEPAKPPGLLYHGTADRNVESILANGIQRRARNHVHLSPDRETAIMVGQRHGRPVVLEIRSGAMHADGIPFYQSANGVWLVAEVPAKYIKLAQ